MSFRPFDYSGQDYQIYVELMNRIHPERPQTAGELRYLDQTRSEADLVGRYFLEQDGAAVGCAEYQTPMNNPGQGRLEVHCRVLPEWGQLTQELWSFLMDRIRPLNPSVLLTRGREDWPEVLSYLCQGFVEEDRMWASTLDVFNFDPAPFLPQTSRALSSGISIRSLAERPYQDGDYRRRHYELLCQLLQDVPAAEPFVPWAFDLWVKRTFESPNFLPEGYFIAIDGEREVGISQLRASSRPQTLQTGLTGVLKEYRRRGIALLLKLRAAQFAKEKGFRFIRTNNHLANRPMLSINEAMGFVKEPAYVHLRKDLSAAYKPG